MAYDISKAFKRIEEELIASMMRNLSHHRAQETEEGLEWTQWQAEQLAALTRYRQANQEKYGPEFKKINESIPRLINLARLEGNMEQEEELLAAASQGAKISPDDSPITAEFFGVNDRKLDALASATTNDISKAEYAVLRKADDEYRRIIFDAQVYANAGGTTYEKAVDMATKDFLARGIQCIQYSNGSMHTIEDYSDMAIKTATKRAYLTGEGEMRKKWGVSTVIINKRTDACPKCMPFAGKIMIDDVWSGGTAEDGPYPLLSSAIAAGLYHPRCRDAHTTYFPGISTPPEGYTKEELKEKEEAYAADQRKKAVEKNAQKYERMAEHSLDPDNKEYARKKAEAWKATSSKEDKPVSYIDRKEEYSDIIKKKQSIEDEVEVLKARKKDEEFKVIMGSDPEAHKKAMEYSQAINDKQKQIESLKVKQQEIQKIAADEISKKMVEDGVAGKVRLHKSMTIDSMEEIQSTLTGLVKDQGLPPLKAVKYDPQYVALHGGKDAVASYDWNSQTMNIGSAAKDSEAFAKRRKEAEDLFSERQMALTDIRQKALKDSEEGLKEAIENGDKGRKALRISEINRTTGELSQSRKAVADSIGDVVTHEYGHHVHNIASGGTSDIYGKKELGARKVNGSWHWGQNNAGFAKASEISQYASENPLEAFAEAFTAKQKGIPIPESLENVVNGAVEEVVDKYEHHDIIYTGARIVDPFSKEAEKFAKMYYAEIRSFSTDAAKIAKHTGINVEDIERIKKYLFETPEFTPDCAIAQSWQRLMLGKDIQPHDITLLNHELFEMQIKDETKDIEHWKAHEIATKKHNYQQEVEEYYGNLVKHNEK